MNKYLNTLMTAALILITQQALCATYGGGAGTADEPYIITTAQQMQEIGANVSDWDKHFILTANIDMAAYTGMEYNIIGKGAAFRGTFDGNGKVISNLNIDTAGADNDLLGLFGYVGYSSEIKNLGLKKVNITSGNDSSTLGGLAGENDGTITNCYAMGSVSGGYLIGCLIGSNYGTITNSYAMGTVGGYKNYVGGLAGDNVDGSIINCYAKCTVSGDSKIGGLTGHNDYGSIINCYAICIVSGTSRIGGLTGENDGTITNCFVTGTVGGDDSVGGMVGDGSGAMTNCYAICTVSGRESVGGLVGVNSSTVTNCYVMCDVSGLINVGGLVGDSNYNSYYRSFWSNQVNQNLAGIGDYSYDPVGVMGRTTLEMQTQSTFTDYGWDFVGESANGTEDVWHLSCDDSYPTLSWQPVGQVPDVIGLSKTDAEILLNLAGPVAAIITVRSQMIPEDHVISQNPSAGCEAAVVTIIVSHGFPYESGSGTATNPFQIWTAEQMNAIGAHPEDWDKHFILMNDIDLSAYTGTSYNIIGNTDIRFTGLFDGNGHVISNFTYVSSRKYNASLFGRVDSGGQIRNLGVAEVNVDAGSGNYVGGLAGNNNGFISNCYVTGNVRGNEYIGGLVGYNNQGNIHNCYARVSANGQDSIGGLVGTSITGTIEFCYAAGSVEGRYPGGITGTHWPASSYNSCFWDSDINAGILGIGNFARQPNVMGRTTLEMQTQSTYTDHGWDFVDEDVNGTDDTWRMCVDGVGYPKLAWEHDRFGDFECPDGTAGEDLMYFADHWLSTDERADLNHDGSITFADFAIFAENWMQGF